MTLFVLQGPELTPRSETLSKVALSTAYDTVDRIAEKVFDAISVC